jgi:hypothetical protein
VGLGIAILALGITVHNLAPNGSANPSPSGSPAPSVRITPTSPAVGVGEVPTCRTRDLSFEFRHSQGAAGTEYGLFDAVDLSSVPCRLAGYVTVQMVDIHGSPLSTKPSPGPAAPEQSAAGRENLVLTPGAKAGFDISWVTPGSPGCSSGAIAPYWLLVAAPSDSVQIRITARPTDGTPGIQACGGNLTVSPLFTRGG